MIKPIIFTDLDGSFLDHETYSAEPAATLAKDLLDRGVAHLVPTTSKTLAELDRLSDTLPFRDSIKIVENGSVIHGPGAPEPIILGAAYASIRAFLDDLPAGLRDKITGFGGMSVADVVSHTGLMAADAALARAREASEPFLWSGDETGLGHFRNLAAAHHLTVQQGGRFYHLTGLATKAQAMRHVIDILNRREPKDDHPTLALGDGPNDLEMIEAADFGVLIPNPSGARIQSSKSGVRHAPAPGPEGWVHAVLAIFKELGLH